jgi:hypothetical protein
MATVKPKAIAADAKLGLPEQSPAQSIDDVLLAIYTKIAEIIAAKPIHLAFLSKDSLLRFPS